MRPQRLYKTDDGRYYFIIDGKRRYIRIPKGMTEAELMKLNIKTILTLYGRRKKRRKIRKLPPKLEKPIINGDLGKQLSIIPQQTASSAFVQQQKPISQIADIITSAKVSEEGKKGFNRLIEYAGKSITDLFKGSKLIENQKTISPTKIEESDEKPIKPKKQLTEAVQQTLKKLQNEIDSELEETIKENENPSKTPGKKRGAEPEIRPTTLAKLMLKNHLKGKKEPTLEEANRLIPSKFLDLSESRYTKALEIFRSELESPDISSLEQSISSDKSGASESTSDESGASGSTSGESGASESKSNPIEQAKSQMGFGTDDGLYNDEIEKIIKKRVRRVIPVIPSDKVDSLLDYVQKGDKKFAAVINTNPSTSDGSGNDGFRPGHWRAIFIDNEDDFPSVEYFDPLAEGRPEKSLVNVMRKLCKKINPEKMCLYKQNAIQRQAKEKSTCGWHTLQFIDDRWNGVPWSEATGFNHYIENLSQPADDSVDGEKEVSKYIKKYKVYL